MASISGVGVKRGGAGADCGGAAGAVAIGDCEDGGICANSDSDNGQTRTARRNASSLYRAIRQDLNMSNLNSRAHLGGSAGGPKNID